MYEKLFIFYIIWVKCKTHSKKSNKWNFKNDKKKNTNSYNNIDVWMHNVYIKFTNLSYN